MNSLSSRAPGQLREDFPFFSSSNCVYLDSAASAQKPSCVIDTMTEFYRSEYSNIHRGVYKLAEQATQRFESVRHLVAKFIHARSPNEIIFTHGATESVNLVAYSWGDANIREGDEIIVSLMEHHANFVPWQRLAERTGAVLRFVGLSADETFDLEAFRQMVSKRTRLVAVTQLSNALGISPPLPEIVEISKGVGARLILDGAQGIVHRPVDVQALGVDFYAFSGHKLYGPTGIGVLWGKEELLETMPPFLTGGDMIASVSKDGTTFRESPSRFEAGTPHVAGVLGLGAAVEYVYHLDRAAVLAHERKLVSLAKAKLNEVPGLRILASHGSHEALLSFTIDGIHPHDVAQGFSAHDVAIRAGHHCAQPLMKALGVTASNRISFGLYNSEDDVKHFSDALRKVMEFFKGKGY